MKHGKKRIAVPFFTLFIQDKTVHLDVKMADVWRDME